MKTLFRGSVAGTFDPFSSRNRIGYHEQANLPEAPQVAASSDSQEIIGLIETVTT